MPGAKRFHPSHIRRYGYRTLGEGVTAPHPTGRRGQVAAGHSAGRATRGNAHHRAGREGCDAPDSQAQLRLGRCLAWCWMRAKGPGVELTPDPGAHRPASRTASVRQGRRHPVFRWQSALGHRRLVQGGPPRQVAIPERLARGARV